MTPELAPRKPKLKEKTMQGPIDESTVSAVTMLPGHSTEVRKAVLPDLAGVQTPAGVCVCLESKESRDPCQWVRT